jgi:hypothetical protein
VGRHERHAEGPGDEEHDGPADGGLGGEVLGVADEGDAERGDALLGDGGGDEGVDLPGERELRALIDGRQRLGGAARAGAQDGDLGVPGPEEGLVDDLRTDARGVAEGDRQSDGHGYWPTRDSGRSAFM